MIIVSHDPAEVLSMADELLVLKDGAVLECGEPKKIYRQPQFLYTAKLLTNCNVLARLEANICGIETKAENVVIYPEWIKNRHHSDSKRLGNNTGVV